MRDLWSSERGGPQLVSLEQRFEKSGLTVAREPIPWNADGMIVEAVVRHEEWRRAAGDYRLHVVGSSQTYTPLEMQRGEQALLGHLRFRLPPPAQRTAVELRWRSRSLGQMTISVLSRAAFLRGLSVELPSVAVRLGEQIVPCQTFVASQGQELLASAVLTGETSLTPLVDLDLRVEFTAERSGAVARVMPVRLTASQLGGRRALITAGLPRPRGAGAWQVTWEVEDRVLACQRLRAVTKPQFLRSLRLRDAVFVTQDNAGRVRLVRGRPASAANVRIGPCFVLHSAEPGMAGLCAVQVRAQSGATAASNAWDQEVLVSDGPTPVVPGTLAAGELAAIDGFELRLGKRVLGVLPLAASPAAKFDAEGGFQAPQHFLWNDVADQELHERLNRLVGGS